MGQKNKFLTPSLAIAAIDSVYDAIIRYKDYTKMLDRMIKSTEDAVAFLESKKKKLQDKKKAASK